MNAAETTFPSPCTTVYFNSACPVCDAGIRYQRRQMQGRAITFVDVHGHPEVAQELDIDLEALRERLHVRDAAGKIHVGDDALATLWSQTRGQRWMAWLTGPLYNLFARFPYSWNGSRGHW